MTSKEQRLIDICFEIAMMLSKENNEETAKWVSKQLRDCGFDTTPVGSSWGVLK